MVTGDVTALLIKWSDGDALGRIFPLVYNELRRIAARHMRRELPNHLLQATALVNEAYVELVDQEQTDWKNRVHFFAIAAKVMRHILVDQARSAHRQKRGGGFVQVTLADSLAHPGAGELDALALDEALTKLARRDARKARVVELRYFAGLEIKETAELLNVSVETVARDLRLAKVWLERELERSPER